MRKKDKNLHCGFTLIEMAFVIIIVGVLTAPLLMLYKSMIENKQQEDTRSHLADMNSMISAYFETQYSPTTGEPTHHYPCPSDRALPPSSPNYRKQFNNGNCSITDLKNMPAPLVFVSSMSHQPPVCTPNFGFCIIQGNQDKDGDGGLDPILIGGIPIRDMLPDYNNSGADPIPESNVLDGWGDAFTYAASQNLVSYSSTLSKNNMGVISVIDENNIPTAGINNDAHYVIISHGPDRKGAYSADGSIGIPCSTVAVALDSDNCDNDSTFRSALGRYQANLPSFFDDYIVAYTRHETGIWENIGSTGSIHNLNEQNVGVGTTSPTAKVEVAGDIRGDYNALAGTICKKDASGNPVDCFDINAITGSGVIQCPNPGDAANKTIMQGIKNGKAVCIAPPTAASTATGSFSCDSGKYIYGINLKSGKPLCRN